MPKKRKYRSGLNKREYDFLIDSLFNYATHSQLRSLQKILKFHLELETNRKFEELKK